MRDPSRIYPICTRLAMAWSAAPDLRLGQLVVSAVYAATSNSDPFYIEDGALIDAVESFSKEAVNGQNP